MTHITLFINFDINYRKIVGYIGIFEINNNIYEKIYFKKADADSGAIDQFTRFCLRLFTEETNLKGDMNNDGKVDISDIMKLANMILGKE